MARSRLLVPIEDSQMSRRAIELALSLAEKRASEVFLFRVGSDRKYGSLPGKELKTKLDEVIDGMHHILMQTIVDMSKQKELDLKRIGAIHKRFSVGGWEDEILKMAGNISCDTIVMGVPSPEDADFREGKFELTPDLASRIVKRAPCSVFSVKALDQVFVLV